MKAEFERLAYDIALRSLDKQEGLVEQLRTRTNTLLAAASLAASLLGQEALHSSGPKPLTIAALIAFVLAVAASIYVLLPKGRLGFAESAVQMYEVLYDERVDMREVYRQPAYQFDRCWALNNSEIGHLTEAYTAAALALVLELLLLAAQTGSNVLSL